MHQIDYKAQEKLLEAIDKLIEGRLKGLSFNYCVEGNIHKVNTNGTYDIKINGEIYTNIRSISSETYTINNVVSVLVVNGRWEDKKILYKKV